VGYRVVLSIHCSAIQSIASPVAIPSLKPIVLATHCHNLHGKEWLIDIRLKLRRAVYVLCAMVLLKQ